MKSRFDKAKHEKSHIEVQTDERNATQRCIISEQMPVTKNAFRLVAVSSLGLALVQTSPCAAQGLIPAHKGFAMKTPLRQNIAVEKMSKNLIITIDQFINIYKMLKEA